MLVLVVLVDFGPQVHHKKHLVVWSLLLDMPLLQLLLILLFVLLL